MDDQRVDVTDVAVLLSEFARDAQREQGTAGTIEEIVQAATALVPGCQEGSVSLVVRRGAVASQAASGDLAREVDRLQGVLGEGPCIDAVLDQVVRVPDLATEPRWPRFVPAALAVGVGSSLCFRLYVEGDTMGALNLHARSPHAFPREAEEVGQLFAAHAAVALSASLQQDKLARSVVTQQLVGQAQGILMERLKVTDDQAFRLLVQASQRTGTKLRDLAEQLVHGGELAGSGPERPSRPTRVD